MAELVMARVVVPPGAKGGPIAAPILPKSCPDTCWCRPPEVVLEAFRRRESS